MATDSLRHRAPTGGNGDTVDTVDATDGAVSWRGEADRVARVVGHLGVPSTTQLALRVLTEPPASSAG